MSRKATNKGIPMCKLCLKHFWFQECPSPRRAETKVIWKPAPQIGRPKAETHEEDKTHTFYTQQKTSGDFFYCCSCRSDFYSEEYNPRACFGCGSEDWDNPNQWRL